MINFIIHIKLRRIYFSIGKLKSDIQNGIYIPIENEVLYSSEMKMQQGASERRVYKPEAHTQTTHNDAASSFPMSIGRREKRRVHDVKRYTNNKQQSCSFISDGSIIFFTFTDQICRRIKLIFKISLGILFIFFEFPFFCHLFECIFRVCMQFI